MWGNELYDTQAILLVLVTIALSPGMVVANNETVNETIVWP